MLIWNRFASWLHGAPINDPIDRRNAPVIQALFLFLGITTPIVWAYLLIAFPMPRGGYVSLGTSAMTTLVVWICLSMIRWGKFRLAVASYVAALLVSLAIGHLMLGYRLLMMDQLNQFMLLIISALVLGRRALWWSCAALIVVTISGCIVDAYAAALAGDSIPFAFSNLPSIALSYLMVSVILDRTVTALRETLAESESRGRDLQREMAERERAQAQLIHAQKLEATGRLASGIAHDFGNLLDVILGFARQRHDAGDLPDARQSRDALADSLEGVETAARRGTAITRKLLGFSRADLLKPQTFDLRDAVADLQPMLRQLFPPSVRLSLETGDTPLPVYIDRSELEMMLLNVAANARDAMPDGGRFDVRVRDAGDMAGVSLSDSGHGMDAQVLRQIFEPFFSTKNAAEGTGLGLSVIQDLVRAVGGDIHVDSAIGRGTTFVIRLPRAGEAAQAPALNT